MADQCPSEKFRKQSGQLARQIHSDIKGLSWEYNYLPKGNDLEMFHLLVP